jgi:hypothetical protein
VRDRDLEILDIHFGPRGPVVNIHH